MSDTRPLMMEDNSEAQMETDVSSTTTDVPEIQEVSGSTDVETIIVIEKMQVEEKPDTLQPSTDLENIEPSACVQSTQLCEGTSKTQSYLLQTAMYEKNCTQDATKDSHQKIKNIEFVNCKPISDHQYAAQEHSEEMEQLNENEHLAKEIIEPEIIEPEIIEPEIIEPEIMEPEIMEPDIMEPEIIEPETIEPEIIEPETIEPETVEPEIIKSPGREDNKEDSNKSIPKNEAIKIDETTVFSITSEKEASNDSQIEVSSDISEKEHNRSISRELKSLIKSAKESKIISECTQLTSKTRKSRTPLDASLTSVEADKIQGVRRSSTNSQMSNCSEKSDKTKRSMRSQNPEFVNKVKLFLNSVTGKVNKNETDSVMSDDERDENKIDNKTPPSTKKKKPTINHDQNEDNKDRSDLYCWRCHWTVEQDANEKTHPPMQCTICPRSFHYKCLSGTERNKITNDRNWVCPECLSVLNAESSETRSPAMKKISLGMLCELLRFALERLMNFNGAEQFMQPVDRTTFPDYDKYVVHPMDLSLMKNNINEGLYGSTEAFLADTQWILHNSIIFNTLQSKLTAFARALVRMCRIEMADIEACPECYAAAHARRPTWFTDVCSTPHMLLWAKLKGFPHWPAKAMTVNSAGLVDVRFFGAHDRAWVPAKDCYLYSEKDPNNFRTKRQDILDSMQEAELHIRNISRKYGKFVYPPFKTQFDPSKLSEQLKMMVPSYEGEMVIATKAKSGGSTQSAGRDKNRSNSKSSKSSTQDCDISDGEEISVTNTRIMADGAEIAKEEDYSINDKSIDIDDDTVTPKVSTRKRRHSELEEAVITILNASSTTVAEKRKRCDNGESNNAKNEEPKEQVTIPEPDEKTGTEDEGIETTATSDKEPSSSTNMKENSIASPTPKLVIKVKLPKTSTPKNKNAGKDKNNIEENSTPKQKQSKLDKSSTAENKSKTEKRRNSKNKVLTFTDRTAKIKQYISDRKNEKAVDKTNGSKDVKESNSNNKNKEVDIEKNVVKKNTHPKTDHKSVENPVQKDDDLSLAVISQESKTNIINSNVKGLPTISCVRSLLIPKTNEASSTKTLNTPTTTSIEITIEDTSESSIFKPTSTDNVRNMKEAVTKLQKLKNDAEPTPVGRVGVRAFARMSSLEITPKERDPIQVEIKSEPIDLDDIDRHNEKMDLMNAFKLQPVNPLVSTSLREVRINKVVVAPLNTRKSTSKSSEIRVRAKKTFPQPKKADDGRSELNGKNSMVYIPIQPPMTQAPIRGVRPVAANCLNAPNARFPAPVVTSANGINTCPVPLTMPSSMPKVGPATTNTCNVLSTVPTAGLNPSPGQVPTVGQVASTVHTVPLLTSLNGQWTFSLQPVMSVGGLDDSPTSVLNGMSERCNPGPAPPSLPATSVQLNSFPSPNASRGTPPVTSASLTPGNRNDTPAELPRLQQRPLLNPLDASAPMGCVPPPSTAGPLTAKLNQNAVKLTDFFRTLLEDSLDKIEEPAAQVTTAKLQLEQAKWLHQQEINEIKHNHELIIAEMRATFEKEKSRAINDARRAAQVELVAAVKLAKSKQWCANCSNEAQFYCCWNTSYCDYPCQRAHWSQHYSVCTQQRQDNETTDGTPTNDSNKSTDSNKPMPKSAQPQPALAVGGQLAPMRVYSHEQSAGPKPSIIVSMVEDASGNQTMKCVGTYKPACPPKLSPVNMNQKILNTDDNAKKVVTSGGYLIVGSAGGAMARRTPMQYYT